MLATKESAGLLKAMPDDADSAVIAGWRERMNGAFEAIIGMRLAVHRDLKRLVVVIAAGFTCSHECPPSPICRGCILLKSANGIRFQQRRDEARDRKQLQMRCARLNQFEAMPQILRRLFQRIGCVISWIASPFPWLIWLIWVNRREYVWQPAAPHWWVDRRIERHLHRWLTQQ